MMTTASKADPAKASFAEFDRRARAGERLSVAFFGGSLTWGANASNPQQTSYRALMAQYLQAKYPKSSFTFYDSAIGGTGSKLGLFRLERDVLSHLPDLVFLDFSANDGLSGTDLPTLSSYECLLREMVGRGIAVEQIFFGFKNNFGSQWKPDDLHRVIAHRRLAAAYHTATGDSFPFIQQRLVSGQTTIEQLWPIDGAHPDDPGYELFFEAVRDGFEQAISEKRTCIVPPTPVFSDQYKTRQRIRLAETTLAAGWQVAKTYRTSMWFDGLSSRWMGDVIMCNSKDQAVIQPLTLSFSGTFIGMIGEADQDGMSFKVSIDGQPLLYRPNPKVAPTEVWPNNTKLLGKSTGPGRLFIWRELTDQLPPGKHALILQPVFPKQDEPHGQLRIESICVAGE